MANSQSNSPLISNIIASVSAQMINAGVNPMYPPDLEAVVEFTLTELSTDPLVPPDAQAVFVTQLALAQGDPAP